MQIYSVDVASSILTFYSDAYGKFINTSFNDIYVYLGDINIA